MVQINLMFTLGIIYTKGKLDGIAGQLKIKENGK